MELLVLVLVGLGMYYEIIVSLYFFVGEYLFSS